MAKPKSFVMRGSTRLRTTKAGKTEAPQDADVRIAAVDDELVYESVDPVSGAKSIIRTRDRGVKHHYRELEAIDDANRYRNRTVVPLIVEKPAPDVPRDELDRPMVACPNCDAAPQGCRVCDHEGWVTQRQAEDWFDQRETSK